MHAIDEEPDNEGEIGLASLEIYSIKGGARQAIWLTPEVNGKVISMQLDTGSAVSVISQHEFEQHFKHAKLRPAEIQLITYTGEKIVPIGVEPVIL